MPSLHDMMARQHAVPALMRQFAERGPDGAYEPIAIKLPQAAEGFPWPAIVGQLTERLIETANGGGRMELRQAVDVYGPSDSLPTGFESLPELTQVVVNKYGAVPFHVHPNTSEYGGPMTKLTLVRRPITKTGHNHDSQNS